jgi:hypothetical protein
MSSKARHGSITVPVEFYSKLKELWEKDTKNEREKISFAKWTRALLWDQIERKEELRKYGPFLEKGEIYDRTISIRDNKRKRMVELVVKEGDLHCMEDNTTDCVHIGFAWSIPAVYRVLKEHGRKQP